MMAFAVVFYLLVMRSAAAFLAALAAFLFVSVIAWYLHRGPADRTALPADKSASNRRCQASRGTFKHETYFLFRKRHV
jgi:hypothetical protein